MGQPLNGAPCACQAGEPVEPYSPRHEQHTLLQRRHKVQLHCRPLPFLLTALARPVVAALLPQIDDPSVFPGQFGEPFPPNFMEVVRTIFKRLFRVYAHIYHSHFKQVCSLGEEAHLNTCFKHFIFFVRVSNWLQAPIQWCDWLAQETDDCPYMW
jgi:hypothetical protein